MAATVPVRLEPLRPGHDIAGTNFWESRCSRVICDEDESVVEEVEVLDMVSFSATSLGDAGLTVACDTLDHY